MNLLHKIKPLLIAPLVCCTSPLWAAEEKEENNAAWHVPNAELRAPVKVDVTAALLRMPPQVYVADLKPLDITGGLAFDPQTKGAIPRDVRKPAEKEAAGPGIKSAFASVQRDGKPYKTFYNNYIAPHAVLENDTVFTAHQDGQGRPIVDAYDTKKKTWIGPVRASNFGLGADTHGLVHGQPAWPD